MHKFGALIEERGVVLVRLDHEERAVGMAWRNREIKRNAANQEPRRAAGALQDPGEHGRDRGLAVRPGDREDVSAGKHVLGEPLRTGYVALTTIEDRFHQRVTARPHVAAQPKLRP